MTRAIVRFPHLGLFFVVAVLALMGAVLSGPPAQESPASQEGDGVAVSGEDVRMRTEPDPLVSPRTFEEELKEILSWSPYVYESMGRRDPFQPLVSTEESGWEESTSLPDPRGLTLVGVLWGDKDRFGLAEDWRGRSFVLREGDPVWNGHVVRIEQDRAVIRYNHFGMWKTISLHIQTGKEKSNGFER
jgi:hypothetical protein